MGQMIDKYKLEIENTTQNGDPDDKRNEESKVENYQ